MRAPRLSLLALCLLTACTPPPKVAGYSQEGPAPSVPTPSQVAAPPTQRLSPSGEPAPPEPLVGPSSPAVAPPPTLPPEATIAPELVLGEPGGFALEKVSSSGSYFAYCQPVGTDAEKPLEQRLDERGNADGPVTLTLAVGTERFDLEELLAADPRGRFLVTLESGAPFLRDTQAHQAFSLEQLSIDLERDALPDHRSVAFSEDGLELALVTRAASAEFQLSLLDLTAPDPTATVRNLPLPSGRPWRISAEAQAFVVASAVSSGKAAGWPVRAWSQPNLRCTRGTFDAFARLSGPLRDPAQSHALVLPGSKTVLPAPGFVMAVGTSWIRREDDGRLLVVQGKQQRQLASARCGGRILGADAESGWFLVSCEEYRPIKRDEPRASSGRKRAPPPKLRFPLYLLKPGVVRDLDVDLMRFGVDVPPRVGARFLAVRAEPGLLLVDLSKGKSELLQPTDRVLFTNDTEVLLSSGGRLVRSIDGTRQELGPIRQLDPVVTGPHEVSVGRTVYSRTNASWQALTLPRVPLDLNAGLALVPTRESTATRWATGPVEVVRMPDGAAVE